MTAGTRLTSVSQVSEWQRKPRCRQRILPLSRAIHPKGKWNQKELPPDQLLGKLIRLEKGSYQTSITDLRMITNYTFTVDADFHGFPYNVPVTGSSPYSPTSSEQFLVSAETRGCKSPLLSFCLSHLFLRLLLYSCFLIPSLTRAVCVVRRCKVIVHPVIPVIMLTTHV